MADIREHALGGLTLRIDLSLCVGFGDCVERAPSALELDANDVVALARSDAADMESLLAACEACPVDALSIVDVSGRTVRPARFHPTPRET